MKRKEKYKILSADERAEIEALYRYRIIALKEAEAYTIINLAKRFGSCKNTIWGIVRYLDEQIGPVESNLSRLEQELSSAQDELCEFKKNEFRRNIQCREYIKKASALLHNV